MLEKLFNIKKRFFTKELRQTQANIWALEFTKFASMVKREKLRLQHDQSVDAVTRATQQNADKDQVKKLEAQVKQIKAIMDEVESVMEGEGGVNRSLESLVEKRENIKNFIQYNC